MAGEWQETMRGIVDDWLFSDVPGRLPDTVVLPLENPDLYDPSPWLAALEVERTGRSVTIGTLQDRQVGILTPKLGAPAAAMAVEAAAHRGVRRIVGIGYCGGVSAHLSCGDLLIPYAAVAGDGTSTSYLPERYPAVADPDLYCALRRLDAKAIGGMVWSLDAVLMQDAAFVRRCRQLRVDGVDMETAAVLTVARLRGVSAATVLVVSDHPGRGERTDTARLSAGTKRAIELVTAAVGSR